MIFLLKNLITMNRTLRLAAALLVALALGQTFTASAQSNDEFLKKQVQKYTEAIYYMQNCYVDTVNVKNLTDKAIAGALSQLDPHSVFIPAEEVNAMREPFDSDFEGIGVEFAIIDDTVTVQDAIAGGPSYEVGIVSGDKIVSADGRNLAGVHITNDGVRSVLRGKKGTTVNLEVVRHGVAERLDFKVVRDRIPNKSVYAAYEVSPGILYIKLSRFAENSAEEVGMPILDHSGAIKGIILDLRGNSGGLLNSALSISNFFLKRGETMLSTAGRLHGEHSEFANGRGMYQQGPLVVLVDENSASASEIVTGALQDWDRAVVIGRRTFGKGLVQQVFDLSDGSEMRLTTDRYLTPSGRLIQTPYQNGKADEYYKAFLERFKKGESFYRDSIHLPDSLKYFTKKSHRAIYGGGGIMPDIFVPRDTSYYTDFYDKILRQGTVVEFMNSYTDRNRDRLHLKYTDFNQFDREYEPDDRMMDDFISFAKSKKIDCPADQVENSRDEVKNYMKAFVGRMLFGDEALYRIFNEKDRAEIDRAKEVLQNPTEYESILDGKITE